MKNKGEQIFPYKISKEWERGPIVRLSQWVDKERRGETGRQRYVYKLNLLGETRKPLRTSLDSEGLLPTVKTLLRERTDERHQRRFQTSRRPWNTFPSAVDVIVHRSDREGGTGGDGDWCHVTLSYLEFRNRRISSVRRSGLRESLVPKMSIKLGALYGRKETEGFCSFWHVCLRSFYVLEFLFQLGLRKYPFFTLVYIHITSNTIRRHIKVQSSCISPSFTMLFIYHSISQPNPTCDLVTIN